MSRFASTTLLSMLCLAAVCCFSGCQTQTEVSGIGGNLPPSSSYVTEGIEYYPTGPKFKLTDEAAAMKAHHEAQASQQVTDVPTPASKNMQPVAQPIDNSVYVSAD